MNNRLCSFAPVWRTIAAVYLRLVDVGGGAVTHRAQFNAALALEVPLTVKLLANALCPLSI